MNREKYWYAIYTKPNLERKVACLLGRKRIECYCPLNRITYVKRGKGELMLEPLFKSYVFVFAGIDQFLTIRHTIGVINFMYWLGSPVLIKPEIIDTIKNYVNVCYNLSVEKIPVNVNGPIITTGGPLIEQKGDTLFVKDKSTKVLIPVLGYALLTEDKANVEVVSTAKRPFFKTMDNLMKMFLQA